MAFQSFSYVLFLPLVMAVNFWIPRKYRYIWLFAASCFFYLSGDARFGAGLLFCTATTYGAALLLGRTEGRTRKAVLGLCITVNVLALLLFRYSVLGSLFVPVGMSFYALQAMGYVIDVYRNQLEAERNPVRYGLFVAFFPAVMSGPIQRAPVLLAQIREGRDFDYRKARSGLYYLLWGYLLKLVVANQLGGMVDYAYGSYETMPGATLLWATVLYAVQLYCDFAGYSALAIGTGKILGFDMSDNFRQPYFAASVREFWKRWHISLSSWLRDYVYIPLGGNRKGAGRKYVNLMLTFLVSGLWHGSGANFLVWGALHGVYQIADSLKPTKSGKKKNLLYRGACALGTFLLADFAWLFFRADSMSQAAAILYRILFCFHFQETTYYGSYLLGGTKLNLLLTLAGIAAVFLVDFLHERKLWLEEFTARRVNIVVRWTAYLTITLLLLLVIVRNYGQAASTFIYTRF